TFAAAGAGEQWDPETGLNTPLDGPGPIPAALGPYDGLFFRFAEAGPARRLPAVSGTLPGLTLSSLPEAPVSVGKGEFVEAKLTPAQLDGVDGWQAEAVLTKSDVDTFLFASFAYPTPVDLSGAACLVLDTVVPEGQRTSTSLLIILRDANGVEYVGHTGRPLGALGPCRGFVPMRSFERAGWSKGPEGPLNRSAIASINIGWGGYLGKEGETVTFTMTPLQQGCFVK
ncbi:MAG: hypothetical protein QG656_1794, partial [Candidatus Hydrogenedentes bacterium]|nr:hypothetical protein [Candidatus Hydrogenedentota bacterium]